MTTDVTVVIPTRGRAPWLREAIASVSTGGTEVELIVVEDGTVEVAPRMLGGAELLRLPHVGRSAARNAGAEAAAGTLVAFLDADDLSCSGRFERQATALHEQPSAALCFGCIEPIDEQSRPIHDARALERARFEALLERGPSVTGLLVDCPIYTSATMVRRDAFLAAGGYDPRLDAYEDLDLYLRLARDGTLVPCRGPAVSAHRRHAANTASDYLYAGALRVVEKHLPGATGEELRLLLERRVDSLWGLGDFAGARREARRALVREPLLVRNRRLVKRLALSSLPQPVLRALRSAR